MEKQPVHYLFGYKALFITLFLLLIIGAFVFPFAFETTTLWYKFGTDKLLLRAGQTAGLLTLLMLCLQIILSTRGPLLEQLFGASSLLRYHRLNGIVIVLLAAVHVFLVLVTEGFANLPIGKKYWTEMIGAGALLLLFTMVLTSHFRGRLKFNYKKWKRLHQPLGYLVVFLVITHVYFVSDAFEQLFPQIILAGLSFGLVIWVGAVKWRIISLKKK